MRSRDLLEENIQCGKYNQSNSTSRWKIDKKLISIEKRANQTHP